MYAGGKLGGYESCANNTVLGAKLRVSAFGQVKALQEAGDKGMAPQAGVVLQGLTYLPGNNEKNFQAC